MKTIQTEHLSQIAGGTTRLKPLPIPPQRPPRLCFPPQRPVPILPGKPDVPPPSCPSVPLL
jgi:hypothetical protein